VRDECPRDSEDPRISGKWAGDQLGQLAVEARRKIMKNFPDLNFDEMIVIEQPFSRRRDVGTVGHRRCRELVAPEQNPLIVAKTTVECGAPPCARPDRLCGGEARGVVLEAFQAKQFAADDRLIVPWRPCLSCEIGG
jgi:hypothetical protein